MAVKEGSPRKHTQSVQPPRSPAGPGSQRLFEKKRSRCSFLKKSNKKALCEKFFTVFVEPMAFACVFLLFENAARKKCFYTWSSRVFFHLNTLVGSKKLFCWLIFVHVFTLTISLKGALFTKICLHMFFPNRSLLLGFSWCIKEGSPRKHTQSVQRPLRPAGPGVPGPFENSSGFTIKSQNKT